MTEKKNLIGSVYILDPNDRDPEGDRERLTASRPSSSGDQRSDNTARQSSFLVLLLQSGLIAVLLVSSVSIFLRVCRSSNVNDDSIKQFRTSFRGLGGHVIEQEIVASAKNNTIEYRIVQFPEEIFTIVDDFNKRIQVVKILTQTEELCYISELKQRSYPQPSELDFGSQVDKPYVSQVYETFEREAEETQLGERGAELCRGIPVEWIRPVGETETKISAINFTEPVHVSRDSGASGRRSQRSIRKCRSSCCKYMCCCNVHHFTWQRAEHFTCNSVCKGCGRYKPYVRDICRPAYTQSRKTNEGAIHK